MTKLIGTNGTIEVGTKMIIVTPTNSHPVAAPMRDLDKWMKKMEIYTTEDGNIRLGNWE